MRFCDIVVITIILISNLHLFDLSGKKIKTTEFTLGSKKI